MRAKGRLDCLVVSEIAGIVNRMPPGDVVRLAMIAKSARGIGLRGVEQPIVRRFANGGDDISDFATRFVRPGLSMPLLSLGLS
jgi:hypothetical protein